MAKTVVTVILVLSAATLALLWGCSDGNGTGPSDDMLTDQHIADTGDGTATDTAALPDAADDVEPDEDADVGVDTAPVEHPCHDEIVDLLPAHDTVATTQIQTEKQGEGYVTFVDATAGGMQAAHSNPYIYFSFDTLDKVQITDLDALSSTQWHLGFKRAVMRANGGDSGPANVSVGRVTADFDSVQTVAPGVFFYVDEFIDDNCEARLDPINDPITAFTPWYDFDMESMRVTPQGVVFLIKLPDGSHLKMKVVDYYDPNNPDRGGVYTIKWAWIEE